LTAPPTRYTLGKSSHRRYLPEQLKGWPKRLWAAGRTAGYGPGAIEMNLSMLKDFRFGERHDIQFRLEALNFINHANFALPNVQQGSAASGTITSLIPGNQSRIIPLGLHYKF
jgi:hypothetical protein